MSPGGAPPPSLPLGAALVCGIRAQRGANGPHEPKLLPPLLGLPEDGTS